MLALLLINFHLIWIANVLVRIAKALEMPPERIGSPPPEGIGDEEN